MLQNSIPIYTTAPWSWQLHGILELGCLAVFFIGVAGVVEWSHPKQALNKLRSFFSPLCTILNQCISNLNDRKCSIPFGSFVSDLYSKSGDLALSVQLWNDSNLPINKKKKQNALREVRKALLSRGNLCYIAPKIDKYLWYTAHSASMK